MKTSSNPFPGILAALLIVSLTAPLTAQEYAYNSCSGDNTRQYKYSDSFTDYEVQTKGEIRVSDDDTRILSISPGGYLKISKKTFGNKRALIIESNSGGTLSYEYYEGRSKVPYEPEGKKWLADVLLDVVRITGIDAKGRTDRIYSKSGINGFLEEVNQISSNSVSALYFEMLLDNRKLNEDELISICSAISGEIDSNTERGRLFRKYSDLFMSSNTLSVAYFESVSKLSSNTERGSVLRSIDKPIDFNDPKVIEAYFAGIDKLSSNTEAGSVLRMLEKKQALGKEAYVRLLVSVKKLSSNTEMGSVMRSLKNIDISDPEVSEAWFNALDVMSSNTEAGSTMRHLINNHSLNESTYVRLLGSVRKLTSNTEAGSVLRSIPSLTLENPEINTAYFLAVSSMSSNTEQGSVLRYCLNTYHLNNDSWAVFFMTAGKMTSNTEMGSVLRAAISSMPFDREMLDAFFSAANHMSSNTEKGRVLRLMSNDSKLNKDAATGIINSARIMSSNTEKSSVLRSVANTPYIQDEQVKEAYISAAKTLSSDTEYRLVMDALLKN